MDAITPVWNFFLVHPLEGFLRYLTEFSGNAGIAIILLTLLIRTAMLPLSLLQIRSQKAMLKLQPQLRDLQQRYGSDRQRMAQEQMRIYKENGVNPAAGCLPLVLQMPIWFALYSALINLANNEESFQASFLWIPNLAHSDPFYILPVLTGATQWVVQRMSMMPTTDPQQQQMNRMMEFMPLMFLFFSLQVASGLALYWVISNLYTFVQQYFTMGWGTLPYLGNRQPAPDSGTPGATNGPPPAAPGRGNGRRGPGSSPRRRKK